MGRTHIAHFAIEHFYDWRRGDTMILGLITEVVMAEIYLYLIWKSAGVSSDWIVGSWSLS